MSGWFNLNFMDFGLSRLVETFGRRRFTARLGVTLESPRTPYFFSSRRVWPRPHYYECWLPSSSFRYFNNAVVVDLSGISIDKPHPTSAKSTMPFECCDRCFCVLMRIYKVRNKVIHGVSLCRSSGLDTAEVSGDGNREKGWNGPEKGVKNESAKPHFRIETI